jgi:hypothetical protein
MTTNSPQKKNVRPKALKPFDTGDIKVLLLEGELFTCLEVDAATRLGTLAITIDDKRRE